MTKIPNRLHKYVPSMLLFLLFAALLDSITDPSRTARMLGTFFRFFFIFCVIPMIAFAVLAVFLILREQTRQKAAVPSGILPLPETGSEIRGEVVKSGVSADNSEYHLLICSQQKGAHPVYYMFRLPPDYPAPAAGAAVMLWHTDEPLSEPQPLPQDDTGCCLLLPYLPVQDHTNSAHHADA